MPKPLPTGWTCDPNLCEYLGTDAGGTEYWRVRWEVVTHMHGATRWLCTYAAWPVYQRIYPATTIPAATTSPS